MGLKIANINAFFRRLGEFIVKFRYVNMIFFALLLFISFKGLSGIRVDASEDNWFVENDPMLLRQNEFEDIFGNDEFCAILVEADDVFQPEILAKIREFSHEVENNVPFADEVISLTDFEFMLGTEEGMEIIDLVPDEIPHDPRAIEKIRAMALGKKTLLNKFVSSDSHYTWVLLRMLSYPGDWENDAHYWQRIKEVKATYPQFFTGSSAAKIASPQILAGYLFDQISRQEKYASLHAKSTGLPILNYEKRTYFNEDFKRLMMLALPLMILILAFTLRSVRGVVFPLICVFASMFVTFGIEGFMGVTMDPTMIPLPIFLGMAVSVGYSVHIFSFFKRGLHIFHDRKRAAIFAVEESGWPVLFTALTTISALCSFLFIKVRVLRWVGLTAAGLVGVTFLFVLFLLPSFLCLGRYKANKENSEKTKSFSLMERMLEALHRFVMANPKKIITVVILVSIFCAWGLSRVEVAFDMERTIGRKVPYVNRFLSIGETPIGSVYSYNLGLEFSEPGAAKDPENLRRFQQLEQEIHQLPLTTKTSSLLDVIKDINQTLNANQESFFKIPEWSDVPEYAHLSDEEKKEVEYQMLAQELLLYENAGGTEAERWIDYDNQRLSLMVEVSKYSSAEFLRELDYIQSRAAELFPDAQLTAVGTLAKFGAMQGIVAVGQIKSFFIALVIIAILLMAVFGSVRAGLIGMIPNITPALVVGGIMGWWGIPLDMITVTIIPMLLGLAVDDTIHFINHAHLEFDRQGTYQRAIRKTFLSIGTALIVTSLVLTFNFAAYLTSSAKIYSHLGVLATAGILSALFTDLLLTPILIKWAQIFGKESKKVNIDSWSKAA